MVELFVLEIAGIEQHSRRVREAVGRRWRQAQLIVEHGRRHGVPPRGGILVRTGVTRLMGCSIGPTGLIGRTGTVVIGIVGIVRPSTTCTTASNGSLCTPPSSTTISWNWCA